MKTHENRALFSRALLKATTCLCLTAGAGVSSVWATPVTRWITMDAVAAATAPEITEEMYEQLDYLEKHPEENYYENEESFSQYDQGD